MRILYDFVFFLFSLFYLPLFLIKGKSRGGLGSRLGRVDAVVVEKLKNKKVVWVHAVSVGEVALALRLLSYWRTQWPGTKFVLTTTTVTGQEVASKALHPDDVLLQFPVDFRFAVKRFIRAISPSAVVFLETEIWPNLIWELSAEKIPFYILNGRISDKAVGKYRRVRFFLAPLLKKFTSIGAQDQVMQGRFIELGAETAKTGVTGNLKYDWAPPQNIPAEVGEAMKLLKKEGQFLCIAASTHEGEEAIFLDLYKEIRQTHPDFRLLLAPRHPERFPAAESAAQARGMRLKRVFTAGQNGYDEGSEQPWLLDRMGVLAHFYGAADAVFVGGSLVPAGGHNPVEPAYYGRPVLFGPHMNNFSEMSRLFLEKDAAVQVKDPADLRDRILYLMQHEKERLRMGEKAKALVASHRGALQESTHRIEVGGFKGEF